MGSNAEAALPVVAPVSALSLVRPIAQPADLIAYHGDVAKIIQEALTPDVDYGTIPGTGDKPSLFKPGAERLNLAFGVHPTYRIVEQQADHDREVRWTKRKKKWNNAFQGDKSFTWDLEEGVSLGLYRYVIECRLMRGDRVLASCIGVCSTLESKYIDRPRDCENTALKMAQKRAYVGATLHAYGLSNRFTQDVEDHRGDDVSVTTGQQGGKAKAADRGQPYDGSAEHETELHARIRGKVPEALWGEVHTRMLGRYLDELVEVVRKLSEETRAKKEQAQ